MPLRLNKLMLSLFSGLLLTIAWYWHLSILIFFAFVPLLMVEDLISVSNEPKRKLKTFGHSFLVFSLWNVGVTWWIYYASDVGSLVAFFPNALLMCAAFMIFSNMKKRLNKPWGVWLFVPVWLAFEYGHSLWDLAWIWLNCGNVFAFNHHWVQWYEFTGASGGTLWVLVTNILIFRAVKSGEKVAAKKLMMKAGLVIIVPILLSYLILALTKPLSGPTKNIVVVQPNIDPYNEKFATEYQLQFFKMLNLIRGKVTDKTDYLVLPETFVTGLHWAGLNENRIEETDEIKWFRDSLLAKFPQLKIVVGTTGFYVFPDEKSATATSRKDQGGVYFDCYNSAVQIDKKGVQIYHKSKLVPGVERMPFPALFKPLEEYAIDLGGTTGSLGTDAERKNFYDETKSTGVSPVICYESVFSDYVADYIRKGSDFIFIVTNDGWWSNSPGHVHHLHYAKLRAIENRRQIARSANTGISCFIDEFGNIHQATKYWEEAVITADLNPNKKLTFFTSFGDLISYTSVIISLLTLVFAQYLRFKK